MLCLITTRSAIKKTTGKITTTTKKQKQKSKNKKAKKKLNI